jgi:hypothetical protein
MVHALAFHANVRVAPHIVVVMRVALLNQSIKFNAVFSLLPTDIIAIKTNFYVLRFP